MRFLGWISQILWVQFLLKIIEKKIFYLVHCISATIGFQLWWHYELNYPASLLKSCHTFGFSSHQRNQSHANPKKPNAHTLLLFPFEIKKGWTNTVNVFFNLHPLSCLNFVISITQIFKSCLDMVLGNQLCVSLLDLLRQLLTSDILWFSNCFGTTLLWLSCALSEFQREISTFCQSALIRCCEIPS